MGRPIVEIEWEDSWSSHRWNTKDEHMSSGDVTSKIVSVGYLVSKDDRFVRTTSAFDGQVTPNLDCLHSIPMSAVRKYRVIRR